MSTFTPEELTLICLYDPGTRLGAVEELRNMMQYLMYDETELKGLTLRVIAKLEAEFQSNTQGYPGTLA